MPMPIANDMADSKVADVDVPIAPNATPTARQKCVQYSSVSLPCVAGSVLGIDLIFSMADHIYAFDLLECCAA